MFNKTKIQGVVVRNRSAAPTVDGQQLLVDNMVVMIEEELSSSYDPTTQTVTRQISTEYVEVKAWGTRADVLKSFQVGQMVYVEGAVEAQTFPRKDGTVGAKLVLRPFSPKHIKLLPAKDSK